MASDRVSRRERSDDHARDVSRLGNAHDGRVRAARDPRSSLVPASKRSKGDVASKNRRKTSERRRAHRGVITRVHSSRERLSLMMFCVHIAILYRFYRLRASRSFAFPLEIPRSRVAHVGFCVPPRIRVNFYRWRRLDGDGSRCFRWPLHQRHVGRDRRYRRRLRRPRDEFTIAIGRARELRRRRRV